MASQGIRSILPRHINQDSLENFFGAIRSLGSVNPNCHSFVSAYKTLVLNNLISPHSPGANCEEDFAEGSLTSYTNLFAKAEQFSASITTNNSTAANFPETIYKLSTTTTYIRGQTETYIAGYILKKLNKDLFKNCKYCLNQLCSKNISEDYQQLITAREYQSDRSTLKYPSFSFQTIVQQIIRYVGQKMSIVCHHENILQNLAVDVSNIINFDNVLDCPEHQDIFPQKITHTVIKLMINHYCTEVNRILLGKRKIQQGEMDPIKKIAHAWSLKHSKRKINNKFNSV